MAFVQPTLQQLSDQARQMADMENDPFIGTDELTNYINKAWAKTYDLMITSYGEDYFAIAPPPFTFTTDGTSSFYPLPADFYKMLGVDLCLTGNSPSNPNNYLTIWPFNFTARNRSTIAPISGNILAPTDYRYRIYSDQLWLTPVVQAGCTIRVWYAPTLTPLSLTTDQTTMLQPGWDELIIIDAAIKMVIKAEQDSSQLQQLKGETFTRLQAAMTNRDENALGQAVDVYGPGMGMGNGPDGWGYGGIMF